MANTVAKVAKVKVVKVAVVKVVTVMVTEAVTKVKVPKKLVPPENSDPNLAIVVAVKASAVAVVKWAAKAVVAKALTPLPVEAIARGYLIGSGWKDYQRSGQVCGIALPKGLRQAERLPEPIFKIGRAHV